MYRGYYIDLSIEVRHLIMNLFFAYMAVVDPCDGLYLLLKKFVDER